MRRIFALLVLVAAAALVNGCADQAAAVKDTVGGWFGGDDEQKAEARREAKRLAPAELDKKFESKITIKKLWDGRYGKGADELYLKLLPAALDERIFTADRDGRVMAIDASTGKVTWEERDKKRLISGGPGVGEGKVYVGTSEAQVIARNAESGKKEWIADVSSEVLAAPVAAEGVVAVRTGDGKLYALDAETGNEKWVFDRTIPTLTLRGTAPPVIHSGMVIAGFDNGRMTALDLATGKELWETRLAEPTGRSELERLVDIDAEPVIRDETVYIDSFQGRVAAVSLGDGSLEWTRDISSYTEVAVDDENVYVTDERGYVWALSRADGSSVWQQKQFKNRQLTGPLRYRGYVIVGDFEGYLHWLDAKTGEVVGRGRIDDERIIAKPIDIGGAIAGYSSTGKMAAFSAE
ncbi:MAG TPA: outer membrane protein assembly factor BamB [Gammaproteobacteria bacterium]|nr:outer membrane protein assembly factor BamB [Gammaproteobacteria bacterium]